MYEDMLSIWHNCAWVVDSQAADDCDLEPVAYEFFTQAYLLYEEEISVIHDYGFHLDFCSPSTFSHSLLTWIWVVQDSKAQITAIHLIIGTLQKMHVFGVENRDTLTHKATGVIVFAYFPATLVTRGVVNDA